MDIPSLSLLTVYFLLLFFQATMSADTLSPSQSLIDANGNTLVSNDGSFELGFFSPGSSNKRYLGIWYKNIPVRTVVWVANRVSPINDSSGLLMITNTGNLVLSSKNRTGVVWSASSAKQAQNPVLQLLNSGNLVAREEKEEGGDSGNEDYLWQSFDYPSDTLLPGMKLGRDLRTGLYRRLSAWKTADDPSPGEITWGIELEGNPEVVLWKGKQKHFRSGPWNGIGFSGLPSLRPNTLFDFIFVSNEEEVYYMYTLRNKSIMSRLVLNETESMTQRYTWNDETRSWNLFSYLPRDYCDSYDQCGAYGNCDNTQLPLCQCLNRFQPKSPDRWNSMDWNEGCVRNKPLSCERGDGFIKFARLKLPDASNSLVNKTMTLEECKVKCLQNCSCTAYAAYDIRGGGSGCIIWFGDLIDIRQFSLGGQDLYIRMSAADSELTGKRRIKLAMKAAIPIVLFIVILIIVGNYIHKRKGCMEVRCQTCLINDKRNPSEKEKKEDMELPLFEFSTIVQATKNFSFGNKLGEGGFGPVYKGTLVDGQEIAVKRLSTCSGQGLNEFKNEVKLIAKLQHRNLVRLLGCCIEGEEKMLVYEYMPNKSLDTFIFDQRKGKLLNWSKRFQIICGIARGLLYLHQDSRLRIIHRDLKAGNVLLDREMNPKISDFGLARTFGGDQTQGKTTRVVGTYGYMAPEYAIDGLFSVKSDVFSFGILLLEIISGLKNRGFYQPNHSLNLIGNAWKLWNDDRPLELVDELLGNDANLQQIVRCIHISLICIQQHPEDRPSMSSVLLMLGSKTDLPRPKEPGFLLYKNLAEANSSSGKQMSSSVNEISITLLDAR